MMLTDDDPPMPKPTLIASPALDRLGVEELDAYISGLRNEIARAEAEIGRKKALLNAAHGFFKTT